jgi:2-isopropylmalate synthase
VTKPTGPRIDIPRSEWVYDWNTSEGTDPLSLGAARLNDETLRDGLQSPSVTDPTQEQKIELLLLMESIGIGAVDIGLPGAGPRAKADVTALAKVIRDRKLSIVPNCAARTVEADIAAVADVVQATGQPIEVYAFIGSSPIRQYAENWTIEHIIETSAKAIDFAVKQGLTLCYVTEDTTRTPPKNLDRILRSAIDHGAKRLALCDTCGHATPQGVHNLIRWGDALVRGMGADVKLDFHGHNDRGLAVVNALAAVAAGADRVHGTALGIGERVGNAALDQVILNLYLMGNYPYPVDKLVEYVRAASKAVGIDVPRNYPLVGLDAFRTATGVHAAAIIKARGLKDEWLEDRVYSAVPARVFGKRQEIEIGPMSGMSNVRFWLSQHGFAADNDTVAQAVLAEAKTSDHTLSQAEIEKVIQRARA